MRNADDNINSLDSHDDDDDDDDDDDSTDLISQDNNMKFLQKLPGDPFPK